MRPHPVETKANTLHHKTVNVQGMSINIFLFKAVVVCIILALTLCACLTLAAFLSPALAANYYVDSREGNDERDGLTPETAWRSLQMLNDAEMNVGDEIRLKRNATWFDAYVSIRSSGIRLSAYGDGKAPELIGSKPLTDWVQHSPWLFSAQYRYKGGSSGLQLVARDRSIFFKKRGALSNLIGPDEFYHDEAKNVLYITLKPGNHPGQSEILAGSRERIVELADHSVGDVVIENLRIWFSNRYGIAP
jgi:hypothetical protein